MHSLGREQEEFRRPTGNLDCLVVSQEITEERLDVAPGVESLPCTHEAGFEHWINQPGWHKPGSGGQEQSFKVTLYYTEHLRPVWTA